MKNLQPKASTQGYRCYSALTGRCGLVDIYYYRSGGSGGIVFAGHPAELTIEKDLKGDDYTREVIEITGGFYRKVIPLQRKSPKTLMAFAEFADAEVPEIARMLAEMKMGEKSDALQSAVDRLVQAFRTIHTQDTAKVLEGIRR